MPASAIKETYRPVTQPDRCASVEPNGQGRLALEVWRGCANFDAFVGHDRETIIEPSPS